MGHVEDRWYVVRDGVKVPSARHGQGRRYRVRYVVDGRERSGGSFERKIDADRRLTELRADLLRGTYVDPTDTTTVAQAARRHAATRPHSERTGRRVESMIRNHVEGTTLGGRRLSSVRPSEAQAWATDRGKVLAPSTLRLLVGMLRSVYNAAVLDRLVAGNPFARVTLPRQERERIAPLTVAQVRSLADAMPARYRALVLVQAGLGLRVGELLALRVADVDFLGRSVRVAEQVDQKTRKRVELKTPSSRRTIPLPKVAAEALAEHLRQFPAAPDGLIFHTSSGRPYWQEHYATRVFARAVAAAGLPAGTSSHDLRHHYASVLLLAGESVVAVAERLGHADATLVLTTYGHLMPDSEDRTRKAVDNAWSAGNDRFGDAAPAQGRPR